MVLSIFRIQNSGHAMSYYKHDNYYTKNQAEENTQWYGKAAEELGLVGRINFKDFEKSLYGVDKDGKFLLSDNKKRKELQEENDKEILFGNLYYMENSFSQMITELNISKECSEKIKSTFEKLKSKNERVSEQYLNNLKKSVFSSINKDSNINLENKEEVKKLVEEYLSEFEKDRQRRVGFDLTFSAPKSFSLAALVGKDEELMKAHRESVKVALDFLEDQYAQTRVRNFQNSTVSVELTRNIVAATFEHDTSRKIDPQLHTHCVLLNYTKRKDGSWRAIHQDGFYYNSKHVGIIYQNELARQTKSLGYEISVHKNGTFEINGYTEAQLQYFSKRSQQLKEMGAVSQKDKTKIIKIGRNKKDDEISQSQKQSIWKEESKKIGLVHPKRNSQAIKKNNFILEKVIRDSLAEITTNEVYFKREQLETSVINKILGDVPDYKIFRKKIDEVINKEAKKVYIKSRIEYVPNRILKIEAETIAMMKRGKDLFESIVSKEKARKITDEIHAKSTAADPNKGLKDGQRAAIELMLTSNDRIMAWEGVAGAGKSYSLGAAVDVATKNGFVVKGFSPQSESAKVLALEAKLDEAHTVASLLVSATEAGRANGKEIWIVDEAGLLSAVDAHALLKKAEIENVRVLLVGHTKQLSSIAAGNPFKQLQENGVQTAQLTEGIRQKDKIMKEAVDLLARGEHRKGVEILDKAGKVNEIKNVESIISHMANDYLSLSLEERKKSLFISSTNYEKEEITNIIRSELKSKNELSNALNVKALVPLESNEYTLKYATAYNIGDIVVPHKNFKSFKTTETGKVVKVLHKENKIHIETNKGVIKVVELDSKIGGKLTLFREKDLEIGVGDRIKWTKNHNQTDISNDLTKSKEKKGLVGRVAEKLSKERRLNGKYITVKEVNLDKNTAVFEYENGKIEKVDLTKRQYIDYSYVTTVFSSQGKTCDKIYASVTRVDSENAYVAISRARFDSKLYTTDKNMFFKNVEKIGANQTAMEIVSKNELQIEQNKNNEVNMNESKSPNYMYMARINRKINNYSFEVVYNLNLNPDGYELSKYFPLNKSNAYDESFLDLDKPSGFKNHILIAEILQEEVNKSLGIQYPNERANVKLEALEAVFEEELKKIKTKTTQQVQDRLNGLGYEKKLNKVPVFENSQSEGITYSRER